MKIAEILSVGDELLSGNVVDTNAAWLSKELGELGFRVAFRQTCGDEEGSIRDCLERALFRSELVLVTGGLGPTYDDITRQVTASVFGLKLLHNDAVEEKLRAYFARRGASMSENNLLQALVPEGATVLENDWGTAPGLWLHGEMGSAVLLPGVPNEMKKLFTHRVAPVLEEERDSFSYTRILRFYGIAESLLDERLSDLTVPNSDPVIAPYAGGGELALHVTSHGADREDVKERCDAAVNEILSRVGEYCYGEGNVSLESTLVSLCKEKGVTLATAESCTGGMLSQRITSVPGASNIFSYGICSYSEEVKEKELGVKHETLSQFGVYSKECALEMARGAKENAKASVGIGITGIAGPDGGTEENPVGTVYIAVVSENREEVVRSVLGTGRTERSFVCRLATSKAISMALSQIR